MKIYVAMTAVFCLSFSFSVSQNLIASSDLVVLSDSEMRQQTGGKQRAKLVSDWKNNFKSCGSYTVELCPSGGVTVTFPVYKCVTCISDYPAFGNREQITSGTSWCITTDVRENGEWVRKCVNRWRTSGTTPRSCTRQDGWCPSTS
jgi:hypothetical protein